MLMGGESRFFAHFVVFILLSSLIAPCVLASYWQGAPHERADYPMRQPEPEWSCNVKAKKLCPKDGEYVKFSSYLRCLQRKRHLLPNWCREGLDHEMPCIGEMEEYCPDLEEYETRACLNHHLDQMSEQCVSSLAFSSIHEAEGRDTSQYWQAHEEERLRSEAVLEEPNPDM